MKTVIFDGRAVAKERQRDVQEQVKLWVKGHGPVTLASVFFSEDKGSVLYTKLKKQAARSAGLRFYEQAFSMATSSLQEIRDTIHQLNNDTAVTGIIIQKPTMKVWQHTYRDELTFDEWWHELTGALSEQKDVDCLTGANLNKLRTSPVGILPATVKAVLLVLAAALEGRSLSQLNVAIVGCSDIIGLPLAQVLERQGCNVTRHCGAIGLATLAAAEVVISATGKPHSITGSMIRPGAIVIDVGSPRPDVDAGSATGKAGFLTPVPGGVGPVTVTCLLENTLAVAHAIQNHAVIAS